MAQLGKCAPFYKYLTKYLAAKEVFRSFIFQLLFMIGESFDEYSDEICGAFVNVRKLDKISLWTANADKKNEILEIG